MVSNRTLASTTAARRLGRGHRARGKRLGSVPLDRRRVESQPRPPAKRLAQGDSICAFTLMLAWRGRRQYAAQPDIAR